MTPSQDAIEHILAQAEAGLITIRLAAEWLGWAMDDVQESIWGEIRL